MNKEQHARFLETARALKCDEDEAAFDEKIKATLKVNIEKAAISIATKVRKSKNEK